MAVLFLPIEPVSALLALFFTCGAGLLGVASACKSQLLW
jgi:hypothetical protein